jgi:hypothetical protein
VCWSNLPFPVDADTGWANCLQRHCNRAGTGWYAADKRIPQNRRKPHK